MRRSKPFIDSAPEPIPRRIEIEDRLLNQSTEYIPMPPITMIASPTDEYNFAAPLLCGCRDLLLDGKIIPENERGCKELAVWQHPRYPEGGFCQRHYEITSSQVKGDWTRIEQ